MTSLSNFEITSWTAPAKEEIQNEMIFALESGKVIHLPHLKFVINDSELPYIKPTILAENSKNISYDPKLDRLSGAAAKETDTVILKQMLQRFHNLAINFMNANFGFYQKNLIIGKTSYRPAEIFGRKSSYRKDDSRLHVDSFPSNPTGGKRILRFFTNINLENQSRVWQIGEPFNDLVNKLGPRLPNSFPGLSYFLNMVGITKNFRTKYDHYMLKLHNLMKKDELYQKSVPREEVSFLPGSSWIVFTDQVSHAAISGKDVLEQTFHLPPLGLKELANSPLSQLEKFYQQKLI